jgi:hypothetical protein
MRSTMLGIAALMVAASPLMADGLPPAPYSDGLPPAPYGAGPTYQREVHTYEYRTIAPAVVMAPRVVEAPVVSETVIVRRPVVVAPPAVVVEQYPVYRAPTTVYAYGGYPLWRGGAWGHRKHFYEPW